MGKTTGKIAGFSLKHLFKKPATISYPKGKLNLPDQYRGKVIYNNAHCVGCHLCCRDCPTGAIEILTEVNGQDKYFRCKLNYAHCIVCGQCIESCKKGCLTMTTNIELGNTVKSKLTEIME